MPADRPLQATRPTPIGDGGFTLVEVLVAIAVIGTVMTALAPFLVQSLVLVGKQRSQQMAIQVANDALERARALDPSSLVAGRGKQQTQSQWDAAPVVIANYLAKMQQVSDPMLPDSSPAGVRAPLPTVAHPVLLNGVTYEQSWYVGRCYQGKADPEATGLVVVDDCGPVNVSNAGLPYYRVVVAVTWGDASCDAGQCVYLASTLVSIGADPRFDLNRPPPALTDPGNQGGYVSVVTGLQILSAGGRLPLTWTSTGLPPGLTLVKGKITGTPTAVGTYNVTVTSTDRDKRADDTVFTWVIVTLPALTGPGTLTSRTGTAVSRSIVETGGFVPLTWSATGLPDGLSIAPATGLISGVPTTVQTNAVTVTVVDKNLKTKSVGFSWRVLTPVSPNQAVAQSVPMGLYSGGFAATATGGLLPYTWKAANLPAGLAIDANTGALSGTVTAGTRYISTITVTDAAAGVAAMTVVFTVTPTASTDLQVLVPSPAGPDLNTAVGGTATLTATASGGTPGYVWTATGLPSPVKLSTTGVLSGKPTLPGTYIVTFTVTDVPKKTAKMMFVWTVTP
jgi:prepilin-type N-terminal cleavage/methylation domain-containing protein